MKRLVVLVSLLIVTGACRPSSNRNQITPNTTKPAEAPVEAKATPAISEADLTAREKQVWEAVEKKDYDAFATMFDGDYLEVNSVGVFDKAAILDATKKVTLSDVTFSDWKILPIDKAAMFITYTASFKGSFEGKAFPSTSVRAGSAWVNRDGKWLSIYHQETDVASPPLPPTSSPSATDSAGPIAKMAGAVTGPDPVANEKLIWDAIKNKDYDGFAALLAPEAVEIEGIGVFDKAGSVKGVSLFDAAKTSLSDWKTVKLDDDTALVTYVVNIPGGRPARERHTTIWTNRGGKWLALCHHGTPVAK